MGPIEVGVLTALDVAGLQKAVVEVTPGTTIRIGRLQTNDLPIPWDRLLSREHAVAEMTNGVLRVTCVPAARNAISFSGTSLRDVRILDGQQFQIGQTVFRFDAPQAPDEMSIKMEKMDVEEHSLSAADLKAYGFENTSRQMILLCDLPNMMASAHSDLELGQLIAHLLMVAIPESVAVAAIAYDEQSIAELIDPRPGDSLTSRLQMMRVETRPGFDRRFMPSRRLVGRALRSNDATIHIWSGLADSVRFTVSESLTWAFCVPIPGDSNRGWCLYVAGEGGKGGNRVMSKHTLEPDVRFTQLLAQFIGSFRQVRKLREVQTQMASFFSPKVIENLTSGSQSVLNPSEREMTLLFCDVRGFSRKSEQYVHDLLYLLECVREALGVMTQGILKYDGAIADFQGDAALGFWGWPVPLAEGAVPACLAALAIADEFRHPERHRGLLDGFSVGLGIAHGRAVAGQIGTAQQAKIGVFGPVVNQGSRIEGLTRKLDVTICIDEQTAYFARENLPLKIARVRALAKVRPKGMDKAILISELLPPYGPECSTSDDHIKQYERTLDLVIEGDWKRGVESLMQLPDDGPKRFLLSQLKRFGCECPADWDGTFSMSDK